jgi:glycerol-3-phosphate acyltransferase PlsY
VAITTRYVSLASILACLTLSISVSVHFLMMNTLPNKLLLVLGWVVAAFVIFKHKSNIGRLLKGTENRFGKKKEE